MFKNFHGFNVLEKLQKDKSHKRERKLPLNLMKFIVIAVISIGVAMLPTTFFGIEGLTDVHQRIIALFLFAALMWLTESMPSWVTSMIVVTVMLLTVSTSAFNFLRPENNAGLVPFKSIMACFANPTIMLFIGGFVLAIGLTKVKLDVALARVLLKPFGTQSEIVLLGFILVTAIFSAFVSNTATAAMMLAFLTPVLRSLPADGKGRIALALAIPIGANLGGMMTPIGTPPNMIALDYLSSQNMGISFVDWTIKMTPFVLVLLFLSWLLLRFMFPFKQKEIKIEIEGNIHWDFKTWSVVAAFAVTIFMWMFGTDLWGVDTNVVAMIPIAIFCATGILTRRDLEEINWSVLWMVAGGFALGVALNYSDSNSASLSSLIVESVPFDNFSPLVVMILAGLICFGFSNFISHSAATSLLVPVLGVIAGGLGSALSEYGGAQAMLVGIAIASSVSMILPISTPPNAIAHSTGFIEQKDMMKVGIIVGIMGLVLGYAMLIFIGF
ncbi:MAG: SLC13/DASS family transporter [Bacteroidaceae bacterium]|nr:SLC13/DASS family transporter [Bacteroidaceae bacterium]